MIVGFTRVVLKPQAAWEVIDMMEVDVEDWQMVDFTTIERDKSYTKWLKSFGGDCSIVYVQDPLRELRYYHLSGPDQDIHIANIRERLPTYDRGEFTALMASAHTPTEKIIALYNAAASASSQRDPVLLDFLTRSLTDPESAVRRAAVDAALLALWPDLREPIERVAATDPDADLRAFAGETLETLRTRVWSAAPGTFDFVPLPPDPRRISPQTGVGDDWYRDANDGPAEPLPPTPTVQPISVNHSGSEPVRTRFHWEPMLPDSAFPGPLPLRYETATKLLDRFADYNATGGAFLTFVRVPLEPRIGEWRFAGASRSLAEAVQAVGTIASTGDADSDGPAVLRELLKFAGKHGSSMGFPLQAPDDVLGSHRIILCFVGGAPRDDVGVMIVEVPVPAEPDGVIWTGWRQATLDWLRQAGAIEFGPPSRDVWAAIEGDSGPQDWTRWGEHWEEFQGWEEFLPQRDM